jgi:hypothetical protein
LKQKYSKQRNLDAALAVKDELDKLAGAPGPSSAGTPSGNPKSSFTGRLAQIFQDDPRPLRPYPAQA